MITDLGLFRSSERTFYPTFNARMISAEEVGHRFVYLPQFAEISQPEHTLILGPRGSGKTTLLKMLLRPAREAWMSRTDQPFFDLRFAAIYVPADTLWVKQLAGDSIGGRESAELSALVVAAFTANVLHSMVESIEMLGPVKPQGEAETSLAKELARVWHLDSSFPSFAGLKTALIERLGDIRALSSRVKLGLHDQKELNAPLLHYHFVDQLLVAISVLDASIGEAAPAKWAICLDEMEILPDWLRLEVLSLLRSTSQRLLFKVSGSPLDHTHAQAFSPTASQPMNDLTVVKLWYARSMDGRKFSRSLADLIVREALQKDVTAKQLLGRSPAEDIGPMRDRYKPDQPFWRTLRAEIQRDPRVADVCEQYGIDADHPSSASVEVRDAFLRKAAPLLLLRNEFRNVPDHARDMRTRKLVTYYTGVPAVLDLADGNPRWLVGMLREMLAKKDASRETQIPSRIQAQVTNRASRRYRAFLRMLPNSSAIIRQKSLTLAALTEQLGRFFSNRLLRGEFTLDPIGSFWVDESTNREVLALIRLGVAQGAFIYCDEDWHTVPDSPIRKRFRLGFLLAPSLKLPLRLYEPISLRESLRQGMTSQLGREKTRLSQQELFGELAV